MEPRELNNRQNYVGDEGCFGGCILPLLALPFMIVLLPFIAIYAVLGGK
jgi:hypothetical protein